MLFRLRYLQHDFELSLGRFIIGRSTECQLSLDDPLVSRKHALLVVTEAAVEVEDLGSRNGVLVNGVRIERPTRLTEGAKITIVFLKADKEVSKVELEVPRSPYRTNAYRTFRAGDGGAWAASVRSADGKELGKAAFTVEVN